MLWVAGLANIGAAGLRPCLTSVITQKAGKREVGVVIGLTQSLMSIAQITAPIISGLLINADDRFHDQHFLVAWAVWAGVLAGAALFFAPRGTPRAAN
jgi:MFS family permease